MNYLRYMFFNSFTVSSQGVAHEYRALLYALFIFSWTFISCLFLSAIRLIVSAGVSVQEKLKPLRMFSVTNFV